MNMSQLVQWFQENYPELVQDMMCSQHHKTLKDELIEEHKKEEANLIIPSNKNKYTGLKGYINPYHIEGDVWTHTMMVCKQAEKAPYEVQIAALLHDIGKPITRSVNARNGFVSFYNHDAISAFMSLEITKRPELNLSKKERINIFNLIALHTQIYKLSEEQISQLGHFGEDFLYSFIELGKADHSGRFFSKGNIEIKEFFKYTIPEKRDNSKLDKEVIILCGLPGSGKSTWIQKNKSDAVVVSRDQCLMEVSVQDYPDKNLTYNESFRKVNQKKVDKLLKSRFQTAKYAGDTCVSIIVDMTHMSKKSRNRSLSHFGEDYKKKCVVFLTDLPTNYLRNQKRLGKVIDKRVLDRMMKAFYPPSHDEFDEIEYVL